MHTLTLGEVTHLANHRDRPLDLSTTLMLPESDARGGSPSHHHWFKPALLRRDVSGDLGSRIQTLMVRTPPSTRC